MSNPYLLQPHKCLGPSSHSCYRLAVRATPTPASTLPSTLGLTAPVHPPERNTDLISLQQCLLLKEGYSKQNYWRGGWQPAF